MATASRCPCINYAPDVHNLFRIHYVMTLAPCPLSPLELRLRPREPVCPAGGTRDTGRAMAGCPPRPLDQTGPGRGRGPVADRTYPTKTDHPSTTYCIHLIWSVSYDWRQQGFSDAVSTFRNVPGLLKNKYCGIEKNSCSHPERSQF